MRQAIIGQALSTEYEAVVEHLYYIANNLNKYN
jgi:hypothetical protein